MYRLLRDNVERVVNDEHSRDNLIKKGYELIIEVQNIQEDKSLNELTVEELKDLSKEKGIEVPSKMKKEELIQLIKDSE